MGHCTLKGGCLPALALLLLALASIPSVAQPPFNAYYIDSAFFAVGAIQPVPCNDGTFVGGVLYCNRSSANVPTSQDEVTSSMRRPCNDICINRSYDGGVTWVRERAQAPYHSTGAIVRMRDGVLLTSDASVYHGFLRSTDHGRTWHRHISMQDDGLWSYDPQSRPPVGDKLTRDDRGTLFWWGFGPLGSGVSPISIDEGFTVGWVKADTTSPYQGNTPWRGHQQHNSTGALTTSHFSTADYGRTFIWHGGGTTKLDSIYYAVIDGFRFNRLKFTYLHKDSLVLILQRASWSDLKDEGFQYAAVYADQHRTRFRLDSSRIWSYWIQNLYRSSCSSEAFGYLLDVMYDSLGRAQFAGFTRYAHDRDSCRRWTYRFADGTLDTTVFPDTTVRKRPWETPATAFYDLDGNLHSNSRNSFQHADHVRPVSILDKLHTCGGMQFLIGGGAINGVTIAEQFTRNATITWTVTPNKRMVFIDVKAVDTSKAVYVCFTVGDSLRTGMTYCDSTNIPTPAPTFKVGKIVNTQLFGDMYQIHVAPYQGWVNQDYVGRPPYWFTNASFSNLWQPPRDVFVRARDRNGCIRCSDTVSLRVVSVDERSDYDERDTSLTLTLAPNPATDEITVEFATGTLGGAPYRMELVNMLGTVVYSDESIMVGGVTNVAVVPVSTLPRGAYVLRLAVRGRVASQVVLVQ